MNGVRTPPQVGFSRMFSQSFQLGLPPCLRERRRYPCKHSDQEQGWKRQARTKNRVECTCRSLNTPFSSGVFHTITRFTRLANPPGNTKPSCLNPITGSPKCRNSSMYEFPAPIFQVVQRRPQTFMAVGAGVKTVRSRL